MEGMTDQAETWECFCGDTVDSEAFAEVPGMCGGLGSIPCVCGGDFCICHNHGDVECSGCDECLSDDDCDGWLDSPEELFRNET